MNKADPVELRKALDAAQLLANAGVLFICIPVLSPEDHDTLKLSSTARLDVLIKQAKKDEIEEGES